MLVLKIRSPCLELCLRKKGSILHAFELRYSLKCVLQVVGLLLWKPFWGTHDTWMAVF